MDYLKTSPVTIKLKSLIKLTCWQQHLASEWNKNYLKQLEIFLATQVNILPAKDEWFNAINSLEFAKIKVVILGQDPYPTVGHAHGLSFSVQNNVKPLPKSLLNINKELLADLNINNSHTGNLQDWNNQGVLLLNTVLTVESGKANAHKNKGWEQFSDVIIEHISNKLSNCVFILWGANAQKKSKLIDSKKHLIISSAHPSPLSAYSGFWGSKPFSATNSYLKNNNIKPINWQLAISVNYI